MISKSDKDITRKKYQEHTYTKILNKIFKSDPKIDKNIILPDQVRFILAWNVCAKWESYQGSLQEEKL